MWNVSRICFVSVEGMESKELFPVTIFKTRIHHNEILKNILVSDIVETSDRLQIPKEWTTNKIRTSYESEPEGVNLIYKHKNLLENQYSECLDEIFDKDFTADIDDIWYNVYLDGEYQELHDHLGSVLQPAHFSCIHFLSFNKQEHEPPEFRDPLAQLRHLSLEFESNNCGDTYIPNVSEGDLIMFPSYLQHQVLPCKKTNYPRITISFNVRVLSYGNNTSYR